MSRHCPRCGADVPDTTQGAAEELVLRWQELKLTLAEHCFSGPGRSLLMAGWTVGPVLGMLACFLFGG